MAEREKTATVQFKLRMRENLRHQLEDSSIFNDTSMNSEIVARLERSFANDTKNTEFIGGQHARLVRAVHDALRSITAHAEYDNDTKQQLCAALIGLAQAISGLKAETLLKRLALDETWRNAAARAFARYEDAHAFVADVMVVDPENEALITEAERAASKYKRPTIVEILGE